MDMLITINELYTNFHSRKHDQDHTQSLIFQLVCWKEP